MKHQRLPNGSKVGYTYGGGVWTVVSSTKLLVNQDVTRYVLTQGAITIIDAHEKNIVTKDDPYFDYISELPEGLR